MKFRNIPRVLLALLITPFAALATAFAPKPALTAINSGEARRGGFTRQAEVAINTPHLLLKFGTAPASQVGICGATDMPVGYAYDTTAINGYVGVERMLDNETKTAIASKAIAAGVAVYTAANGKVTDVAVNNCWLIGYSLTAAAADGDDIEIDPVSRTKQTV